MKKGGREIRKTALQVELYRQPQQLSLQHQTAADDSIPVLVRNVFKVVGHLVLAIAGFPGADRPGQYRHGAGIAGRQGDFESDRLVQRRFLGKDGDDGVKIITAYASNTKAAVFKGRVALENEEVQAS